MVGAERRLRALHRLSPTLERLVKMYDQQHLPDEDLGAFFRRVPPAQTTEVLKDLALLLPNEITDQDYVDLRRDHHVQSRGDGRGVRGIEPEGSGLQALGS